VPDEHLQHNLEEVPGSSGGVNAESLGLCAELSPSPEPSIADERLGAQSKLSSVRMTEIKLTLGDPFKQVRCFIANGRHDRENRT
jgi:hypothetical protein